MSDLVVGIVGYGKIARDQHVPAIAATDGVTLAAIADPFARDDTLPSYPDMAAMLAAHPEINAVTLCQPPLARFAAARDAIRSGRHVFLEKPPGACVLEAETLVDMAREAGTCLFTAWHSREAAAVNPAKTWLSDKAIRTACIFWKEDVRVWHPGQQWISQPGGFGVFDPGINALSILTHILPDGMRVKVASFIRPENWQTPIAAKLEMETLGGVPILAEFDFRQEGPQLWNIIVETEQGQLLLSEGGNCLSVGGVTQPAEPEQEYVRLYRKFIDIAHLGGLDADLAPLRLVADAFLLGHSKATEAFFY